MKSINQLTDRELKQIEDYGHLGISTKDIAELHFFFNSIDLYFL